MTSILIYISSFSGVVLIALFAKNLKAAKAIPQAELEQSLRESRSSFHHISSGIVAPTAGYVKKSILPKVYKEFEIIISKFRIYILRVERMLLWLTHYVRGKREVKVNGSHPYWDSIMEKEKNKENKNIK